jgi:hypothetical protein
MVEGIGCGIDQSAMDGKVSKPIAGELEPQRAKKRKVCRRCRTFLRRPPPALLSSPDTPAPLMAGLVDDSKEPSTRLTTTHQHHSRPPCCCCCCSKQPRRLTHCRALARRHYRQEQDARACISLSVDVHEMSMHDGVWLTCTPLALPSRKRRGQPHSAPPAAGRSSPPPLLLGQSLCFSWLASCCDLNKDDGMSTYLTSSSSASPTHSEGSAPRAAMVWR